MSGTKVAIGQMASALTELLEEYSTLATEDMKNSVKKAAKTVKTEISANAPSATGKYASSWKTKNAKESSTSLEMTVYSPSRYRLAHLLEHGHAKRGGGRVAARPHIAGAEQTGIKELEESIDRALKNG